MHDIIMVLIGAAIKSVFKYLSRTRGDEDTKWSVHFTTQKPQQSLIFIPGKRRSGSADDLQESHGLTRHVPTSSHCHDPRAAAPPSSSGLHQSERSSCRGWKNKSRKMSPASDEDERVMLSNKQPQTPLVLNPLHLTSSLNVSAPSYEPTVSVEIEPSSRLPTPEEKMRQLSEAVGADIVPINITGESFDRQASFRKRLSSADSLSRRSCNLSRQTTLTGKPDVRQKLDSSLVLPGQFSIMGGSVSSCISNHQQKTRDKELEKRDMAQIGNKEQSSAVRIQAPREHTVSVLMAPLTCTPHVNPSSYCCSSALEVQSLSSLATISYLDSESRCTITPYRTPDASSSCSQSQVLQGFPSDLMPLLPFGPKVNPHSPLNSSLSLASFPVSLSSSTSHACESEWSYSSDKSLEEAAQCHSSTSSSQYLSSSSIADSESQFNYQALHDQTQPSNQLSSDESWSYQTLSPSSSLNSSQTGGYWSSMNQETKCVSGEGWNCDPLLSSGRSSPAFSDCTSLCSENIPSSSLLNQEKKKFSTSSYSHTIIRSISLRKSKHPPLPPLRCDSLKRQPVRTKPCHSSSSPRLNNSLCLERAIQKTQNSTQTFHDPWVPRENTKTLQTERNCGTVTTFEPIYPDCDVAAPVASPVSEELPQSPNYADIIPPGSPGSEEETLKFTLNSHSAKSSVVALHRLVSPSSGYSSQSNTPLSSPLAPSSPLTASNGACPLTSPFPSSHSSSIPLSPPISNLAKMRSQVEGRPKPPVPERKSSLFSYSTSSLSSCISSEHPVVPPPPPAPLPSSPTSSIFYTPIFEFAPLPHLCLPAESSVSKLSGTPTPLSLSCPPHSPPPPPPPPPLPTSPLPTPPPLPPSFHSPPPHYSYGIRHAMEPTLSQSPVFRPSSSSEIPPSPSTNLPLPPPPPPPPSYLPSLPSPSSSSVAPLSSPSLSKSLNPCVSVPTCPLVTAEDLQSVKLRSVNNQKCLPASIMLASATLVPDGTLCSQAFGRHADTCHYLPRKETQPSCSVFGNAKDEDYTKAKPAKLGPQNVVCNLGGNETSMSSGLSRDNNHAKWYALQSDREYYNLTKCDMRKSNAEAVCVCPQSLQFIVSRPVTQRTSDCQIIQTSDSKNTLTGISTVKNWHCAKGCCTMERSNVSSMGYKAWTCLPSGNMDVTQDWTTTDETMSTLENYGISGTLQTLGNLGEHGITSAQTDGTQYGATELCTVYKDNLTFYNRIVKSSLAKEEDEEDEKVVEKAINICSAKFHKSEKARRRRKRRTCRQLLMMQSTTKPSPSSSSSSSSSSGDELDVNKGRTMPTSERMRIAKEGCDEETSNSDSSCPQSRCSISSALSSESLCGEFPFPDLLIEETGEKEEEQTINKEAQRTAKEPRELPGDLFISVSADQMFMSSQPRTTEDLFAVIHRSKRKMLDRRSSEETRHCTKSPSTDPGPSSAQPVTFKTSKSSSAESFKALLLRKGSRSNPRSGTSAVERLCKVISPTNNLQSVSSRTPLDRTQVKPASLFHTLNRCDAATRLTPDVPAFTHTHLLFFPSSVRLRSLTRPSSASSRFAAHCRLVAAPMTAISEGVCEEDNE